MILFLSGCRLGAAPSDPHAPRAKYVFLFIGDGMAEVQVAAAGPEFERFPVRGRTTTHDIFRGVTDSAAAATAMATGHKTSSGVLGMNPLGTLSYASIAESARDAGYKVGIVTTVSLDHATPAAFYAKSARRDDYYGIARQIPASRFEYFGGGSLLKPEAFVLIATAGYAIVDDAATFRSLAPGTPPGSGKVVAVNAVLAGSGSMPYDIDRDSGDLSFADYVAKGIELLDGTAGFFMMAEAGKIDWACHANDAAAAIGEVRALDRAVAEGARLRRKASRRRPRRRDGRPRDGRHEIYASFGILGREDRLDGNWTHGSPRVDLRFRDGSGAFRRKLRQHRHIPEALCRHGP